MRGKQIQREGERQAAWEMKSKGLTCRTISQKIMVIDTLPVGLREELAGVINDGLFSKVVLVAQ
jgi:hypothetical protein